MRWLSIAVVCACGPEAGYLEPCGRTTECVEAEDFCSVDLGVCTRVCFVPGLPLASVRQPCVPSADCPGACCLLGAGAHGALSVRGVCAPFAR